MKKRFLLKIQSLSDIITNSSSEVFVINTTPDNVKSIVKDIINVGESNYENGNDRSGGMGGELEVFTWENGFKKYKHHHKHSRNNPNFTPEMWAEEIGISLDILMSLIVVDIDTMRKGTIKYLVENYNANEDDSLYYEGVYIDFFDSYETYDDSLMYREDFSTDVEYDNYLFENMA